MLKRLLRAGFSACCAFGAASSSHWPPCVKGFFILDPSNHSAWSSVLAPGGKSTSCERLCEDEPRCVGYTFRTSLCRSKCMHDEGCCELIFSKTLVETRSLQGRPSTCACTALMRVPQVDELPPPPPLGARNVLYVIFDDLRPELPGPWGSDYVHAPNIARFSESGTTFRKAYCQQSICSPSRMSFLTGRRPTTTRTMNFIDDFRQADCGVNMPGKGWAFPTKPDELGGIKALGSEECCTFCSKQSNCTHWTFWHERCLFYSAVNGTTILLDAVSGVSGVEQSWTSLPEAFKRGGWLTMSTGKVFHTNVNTNPAEKLDRGKPANQDPGSWTPGLSQSNPLPARRCERMTRFCLTRLVDRSYADDAIMKLQLGAMSARSGRPFLLAVGFSNPHFPFDFPYGMLKHCRPLLYTPVPKHGERHGSIPDVASRNRSQLLRPDFTGNLTKLAKKLRRDYYAAVSWVDVQFGRLIQALEDLGLVGSTVVVMHADHGISLGEQGEWGKATNWEHAVRVPLVVRDPECMPAVSDAIVELVDVMPTMMDLAGLSTSVLGAERLQGTSLKPLLSGARPKRVALSVCPRCQNISCVFADRTTFDFIGLSIRTDRWRYTEWLPWDGAKESPRWQPEAVELYDHQGDDGSDFDAFENVNLAHATSHTRVVRDLARTLRRSFSTHT